MGLCNFFANLCHFAGDMKSQATPTAAHSVVETRPVLSEPSSHSAHHTTPTTSTSKTSLNTGVGKNALGLSVQPIGAPGYIKNTSSTSPHLSSTSRFALILLLCAGLRIHSRT